LHHAIFRSAGGTDDKENLTSPCDIDHLELIHSFGVD